MLQFCKCIYVYFITLFVRVDLFFSVWSVYVLEFEVMSRLWGGDDVSMFCILGIGRMTL